MFHHDCIANYPAVIGVIVIGVIGLQSKYADILGIFRKSVYICSRETTYTLKLKRNTMDAVSMNNLWNYIQGLSLTASNRKWLAERLIEHEEKVPPVLQTMEEALSDLDESEREFECGDVLLGEEFNVRCQALIDSFPTN